MLELLHQSVRVHFNSVWQCTFWHNCSHFLWESERERESIAQKSRKISFRSHKGGRNDLIFMAAIAFRILKEPKMIFRADPTQKQENNNNFFNLRTESN